MLLNTFSAFWLTLFHRINFANTKSLRSLLLFQQDRIFTHKVKVRIWQKLVTFAGWWTFCLALLLIIPYSSQSTSWHMAANYDLELTNSSCRAAPGHVTEKHHFHHFMERLNVIRDVTNCHWNWHTHYGGDHVMVHMATPICQILFPLTHRRLSWEPLSR